MKKCKQILITGTHGIGKSTLLYGLASSLKTKHPELNIGVIPENIREISRILKNQINTPDFQYLATIDYLYKQAIQKEFHDVLLLDRGAFDIIIYGHYFNVDIPKEIVELAYKNLFSYEYILYVKPNKEHIIVDDGFRMLDEKVMYEIDTLFDETLSSFKILPVIPIISKDIKIFIEEFKLC